MSGEYDDYGGGDSGANYGDNSQFAKSQMIDNQHFDEALDVSEEESIEEQNQRGQEEHYEQEEQYQQPPQQQKQHRQSMDADGPSQRKDVAQPLGNAPKWQHKGDAQDEDDERDGQDGGQKNYFPQLYDASKYAKLQVTSEIQDLFDYIGRFQAEDIELDTKLKPFIPDYIPAVGEIDSFVKIPPPDETQDKLGLVVIDEPAAHQSDPTVLDLQLRVVSKHVNVTPVTVRSIDNAAQNPKKITAWINNIQEVHHNKPPPTVRYARAMPDIEALMQVWPPEFEEALKSVDIPSSNSDIDVQTYARAVCALLDIPVYDKLIESLHVLLTLYSEFENNSHFSN